MANTQTIAQHYGRADLGSVILAALNAAGKDIDHLGPDDLAPIDELHSRGRESTTDLGRLLALKGDETVLDVGCGIGSLSQHLLSFLRYSPAREVDEPDKGNFCNTLRPLSHCLNPS